MRSSSALTAAMSSRVVIRSVRPRSSPAVCGPREQQYRDQCEGRLVETELLVEHLAVASGRTAVGGIDEADESGFLERSQSSLHRAVVVADDRVAVRGLVAGRH